MNQVTVTGLCRRFGPFEALKGVSLTLERGSVLALLGPSGCGKTTLLRAIAGFDPVSDGRIAFGDVVMASPTAFVPPERRGIGYVPQEGALFPHLTVAGNVGFGLDRRQRRGNRIADVLELTGIAELRDRYPHELSGGQQQRVALARALAPRPQLVLLDEPFNALDLDLRHRMSHDVIAILRKTGTTTILVTHDPAEAFGVADRLAVMTSGLILQCDRPETVYWQPATAGVARLTGATIVVAGTCEGDRAACVFGSVPLHSSGPVSAGETVDVMLRPEQIRWLADSDCGVPARILESSFRGEYTMVRMELDNLCLKLRMPSLTAPRAGDRGRVCIEGCGMAYAAAAQLGVNQPMKARISM